MPVERTNPQVGGKPLPDDPELSFEPEIIEVEDPNAEVEEDESVVEIDPKNHAQNLAEVLPESELATLGSKICEAVQADWDSAAEWRTQIVKGLEELGVKMEETSEPFDGACMATHPLLLENIVKFQSKAVQELLPAQGPVRTRIYGKLSQEREQQASRVKEFMNYQVLEEMVEFVDEFERLLFSLGLVGTAIKKIYFDGGLDRPIAEFVPIDQFIIAYNAPDLRRAERYTHVLYRTKDEFERDVESGAYIDVDLGAPAIPDETEVQSKIDNLQGVERPIGYEVYTLYEHHCYKKLSTDEYSLPYVITVDKQSRKVLSIRRNWHPGDEKKRRVEWFVRYIFVPSTGFLGFGLLHLIGSLAKTATEVMRSLVDSGQFANLQGGFKLRSLRIVGNIDDGAIGPGEWRDVDAPNMDIDKALKPLPYKEPSATLFQLLGFVVQAGQKFADSTEQVISDSSNYGPVGTTMALLEASTRFFSAIHKRLHNSFKQELRILKRINRDYPRDDYPYPVTGDDQGVGLRAEDFSDPVDVIPASDPNTPSNAHRLTRATTIAQMAQTSPELYDKRAVQRNVLLAMEVDNIDQLMPPPVKPQPLDPLSDIMAAASGKAIAAFPGQDHDAHIAVKSAFMQDPAAGGSPAFAPIGPVLAANIREHMVMKYQEAAQAAGANNEQAQAQAAQMVSQMSLQEAQARAQAAQGADPTIQLGMAELEQRKKEHSDDLTLELARLATKNKELDIRDKNQDDRVAVDLMKVSDKRREVKTKAGLSLVDSAMKDLAADAKRRDKDVPGNK